MSKYTSEVYNNSSDTDSTIYIENNEETSEEEEVIINCNNKNVFLNYPLELKQYFFNNLTVKSNLIIPLFLNLPYTLVNKYNIAQ